MAIGTDQGARTRDGPGRGLALEPSCRGIVRAPVWQLREPAIFQEGPRTWLLYSVAGESGIAIVELEMR